MTPAGPSTTARSGPLIALEPLEPLDPLDIVQQRAARITAGQVHHAYRAQSRGPGSNVCEHRLSSVGNPSTLKIVCPDVGAQGLDEPHGSPVLHVIDYLAGRLNLGCLAKIRAFPESRPYPSQCMIPAGVNFSTGSIGIGTMASIGRTRAGRWVADRFTRGRSRLHVAPAGDTKLKEDVAWNAPTDPSAPLLDSVLRVVHLSCRTSAPVVPDVAAGRVATGNHDGASLTKMGAGDQGGRLAHTGRDRLVHGRSHNVDELVRDHGSPADLAGYRQGRPRGATLRSRTRPAPVQPDAPAHRHQFSRLGCPTSPSEHCGAAVALPKARTRCSGRTGWPRW